MTRRGCHDVAVIPADVDAGPPPVLRADLYPRMEEIVMDPAAPGPDLIGLRKPAVAVLKRAEGPNASFRAVHVQND
jgi:hypothetical protein